MSLGDAQWPALAVDPAALTCISHRSYARHYEACLSYQSLGRSTNCKHLTESTNRQLEEWNISSVVNALLSRVVITQEGAKLQKLACGTCPEIPSDATLQSHRKHPNPCPSVVTAFPN
jgi:hypothetical protein